MSCSDLAIFERQRLQLADQEAKECHKPIEADVPDLHQSAVMCLVRLLNRIPNHCRLHGFNIKGLREEDARLACGGTFDKQQRAARAGRAM